MVGMKGIGAGASDWAATGRTMMGNLLCVIASTGRGEVGVVSCRREPRVVDKWALAWHSLLEA